MNKSNSVFYKVHNEVGPGVLIKLLVVLRVAEWAEPSFITLNCGLESNTKRGCFFLFLNLP